MKFQKSALKLKGIRFFFLVTMTAFITPFLCRASDAPCLFRIGTGGLTGVYYPIGKIIALGVTDHFASDRFVPTDANKSPKCIGVAQNSAGSVENVRDVVVGEIEAGLVQADVAAWAFQTQQDFKNNNNARNIRAIAALYSEKFQIVTRRDANIGSVQELRGKRISVDEIGSGTLAVMRIVLEAHNMTENDLRPVYLKPIFTHDKIVKGELQGFVLMAGAPATAITKLTSLGVSLTPIAPDAAARIHKRYLHLTPAIIPDNVYSGVPATPTIQVYALLVVSAQSDAALIYHITAALWSKHTLALLKKGHPMGKAITPETALEGVSIPLHPGAAKYYQEHQNRFQGYQSE